MNTDRSRSIEAIQKCAAKIIATNSAGVKLRLIGGFRYRFLNQSCRTSMDIDYHWEGDLTCKQAEVFELLKNKLLPEVKRLFGYEGVVRNGDAPGDCSPFVKTIIATFHDIAGSRETIDLPVEVTSIICADPAVVRTASGTVYLTASDADMIESKVIALFARIFVQGRDIVDLFLYQDNFVSDSPQRIQQKFNRLNVSSESLKDKYRKLLINRDVHINSINEIIANQIEPVVAQNLQLSGGGAMIFDTVMTLIQEKVKGLVEGDT